MGDHPDQERVRCGVGPFACSAQQGPYKRKNRCTQVTDVLSVVHVRQKLKGCFFFFCAGPTRNQTSRGDGLVIVDVPKNVLA